MIIKVIIIEKIVKSNWKNELIKSKWTIKAIIKKWKIIVINIEEIWKVNKKVNARIKIIKIKI